VHKWADLLSKSDEDEESVSPRTLQPICCCPAKEVIERCGSFRRTNATGVTQTRESLKLVVWWTSLTGFLGVLKETTEDWADVLTARSRS
jgi:hypothetical protein